MAASYRIVEIKFKGGHTSYGLEMYTQHRHDPSYFWQRICTRDNLRAIKEMEELLIGNEIESTKVIE